MRSVLATRYVLALREGGSLPAIVEADDMGMYVAKFRGAGQGTFALTAEIVAGEIGRALGLKVPEIVLVEVDPVLGRSDPDAEIRHLLKASVGTNVGLDYLPGSTDFVAAAGDKVSPQIASLVVWFDSFVQNVDRTPRNPNMLMWHRELYLIDHGAAMYFHHHWETMPGKARSPFPQIDQHVLLPFATDIAAAGAVARTRLNEETLRNILALVPESFLGNDAEGIRNAYVEFFLERLEHANIFEEEAARAYQRQL
ncbi:MAG TPA: HipA family kinase [Terriglobus sp.]